MNSSHEPASNRRTQLTRKLRGLVLDTTPLRQSRDYRLLFIGQGTSQIGGQVRMVTIPYMVFLLTHHSTMAVAMISLAQFVPAIFFAMIGGALADAMDRRTLLIFTTLSLTIASALLTISAFAGITPLWYIFTLVAIAAGIQSLDAPARRAVIPRLVGRDQIANALAIQQVTMQSSVTVGPLLAGPILAIFGIGPALLINTVTFVVSLGSLFFIAPMPPLAADVPRKTGFAALVEGLAFLKGKPVILSTFLIDVNAMFFGGPKALFPALALDVFKVGPVGLGFLNAAPGVGALAGALMSGWVGRVRKQGRAVVIAICVWGAAITAFGLLSHVFWLALVMLAIAFTADQYSAVFRATILQMNVPDRLMGRLSAVHFLVVMSGPQLGNVEAGVVAELSSLEFSVVSGGIAAAIGAILVGLAIPKFWRYDAQTAVPEVEAESQPQPV